MRGRCFGSRALFVRKISKNNVEQVSDQRNKSSTCEAKKIDATTNAASNERESSQKQEGSHNEEPYKYFL